MHRRGPRTPRAPRWPAAVYGGALAIVAPPAPAPPDVPDLLAWILATEQAVVSGAKNGSGDALAQSGANTTLTDAGAFSSDDRGGRITIAGATNAANDVSAFVAGVTAPNTATYVNAAGVTEAVFPGTWQISDRFDSVTDLLAARAYVQATALRRPPAVLDVAQDIQVLGRAPASNNTWLAYEDAVYAALFEGVDVSITCRCMVPVGATGALDLFHLQGSTSSRGINALFNSTTSARISWNDGTNTSLSVAIPSIATGAWFTAGWALDISAGTLAYYQDGVLIGTSAPGTPRAPTLLRAVLGSTSTSGAPGFAFGWGAGASLWTAADFLACHNAFLAYGAP